MYAGWRREEAEMKKEGKQASEGENGANEQVSAGSRRRMSFGEGPTSPTAAAGAAAAGRAGKRA